MSKFKSFEKVDTIPPDQFLKGESSDDFADVKHLHLRFAFDFLSLNNTPFCFNSKLIAIRDYHKLLSSLKDLSSQTYEVMNREDKFHFHEIKWEEVSVSKSDFLKCIYGNNPNTDDITAYQFKVYQEARIIGFIYGGIFYLVMFDRGHNAYKRKDKKQR